MSNSTPKDRQAALSKWQEARQHLRCATQAEAQARHELINVLDLREEFDHPAAVPDGKGGFWIVTLFGRDRIEAIHTDEMQP